MEFKELKETSIHKKEREGEFWGNVGEKSKYCYSIQWVSYTHKRVEEEIEYMMNPYGRTEVRTETNERRREKIRGIKELAEKYIEYMQEVERNPERYSSIFEEWESFKIRIVDQEGEEIEINQETIARKAVEQIEIQEIIDMEEEGER